MKFLSVALALLGKAASECPASHEEVPTLYDDTTFNCMTYWQGSGDPSQLNSCVDCFGTSWPENGLTKPHGYDYTAEPGAYHSVGSLLIKPGCTVTAWMEANYEGAYMEYDGTLLVTENTFGHHFDGSSGCSSYGWGSFKCRCQQEMLDCVPVDGWQTILVCDNIGGTSPFPCSYEESIGTVWSESTSQDMGIDYTIEETISAGLFDIFGVDLGISATTSYDWTHVTEKTQQNVITVTASLTAQPGETVILEQALGQCGGEEPRTEMFKQTATNKDGEVISIKYEHRRRGNHTG